MHPKRKAIALLSGGLDSALAARMVKDQGVEVVGLHLASPFGCTIDVKKVADKLGIPLLVKEKGEAYLELVENPHFGYGRAVNPCIDCRIFMFDIAENVRQQESADFVITGEVVGQRPLSQQKHAMDLIDKNSDGSDRIVRPLTAQKLEPTLPEREGWVDRTKFLDISGRSRKVQLQLAQELGVSEYAPPGGGCALTETSFAPRLRDFFAHPHFKNTEERMTQAALLRYGRHFRLNDQSKLIISRNSAENKELETRWEKANGTLLTPNGYSGPHAITIGEFPETLRATIGEMMLRYSKPEQAESRVEFKSPRETGHFFVAKACSEQKMEEIRL